MKKLVLSVFALFLFVGVVSAQKKGSEVVTNINTSSPIFDYIYGGESQDMGGVRIQIHDRQHQFVSMGYARMKAQSKGNDATNYWVKLIKMDDMTPLSFRQAESLDEAALPVDGLTVIAVRINDLREAALTWYQ